MRVSLIHLIVASLVALALMSGYVLWYRAVSQKSTDVTSLQNQIEAKNDAAARITSTQNTFAEIIGDENLLEHYFVSETGVVTFIDDLEEKGRKLGTDVKVLSVNTGGSTAQPVLLFSLSVRGSFGAVMRTIGAIEYAPYDLVINKFVLGQEEKSDWNAQLTITVGSVSKTATSTKP
jgi:hypothetical protein